MTKKYSQLLKKMKEKGKVAIAFSGGIDSTLVAYAAKQAGIDALLITLTSPLFPSYDAKKAKEIARELGIRHIFISHSLDANIAKNDVKRCYYCKMHEAKIWKEVAKKNGFNIVADGANFDDLKDERRPGTKASSKEGIWHPLAEVKITKEDVRNIAKKIGLKIWNKPSNACLASRIAYGEEITEKKLQMVEEAENFLRNISPQIRVRLHRSIARIEVPVEKMNKVLKAKKEIVAHLKKLGFVYITLDLEGYRSGSMHEEMMGLEKI
ncbi:MAG: ATP-dependent sacrificial sulfur transferase LarE [Thermoplasmata archaeon]|nr:MAG: ATP-dependent sacrificial sulfur transferase LarE [Thermoplasmata archaeon]